MDKNQENNSYHKINLNWYPGHMAKTKKQIIEELKLIDIEAQIIDAKIHQEVFGSDHCPVELDIDL